MNKKVRLPEPVSEHLGDLSATGVWTQLATLFHAANATPRKWALFALPITNVLVIAAIAAGQVRLNDWQGAFYDALQRYDLNAFLRQLVVFGVIVAGLLTLVVSQTWLTEVFKVRLRAWLTRDLLDEWLRPKRAYLFGFAGDVGVNPDQRIQEDARHLTELSADLGAGLVQASLLLVSFVGVLWLLSTQVVFNVSGKSFTIPGYMVWCALAYAGAGSWLTWYVGRPLVGLNAEHYAREADFRVALVRVVEHSESVALYQGEADERVSLDTVLNRALTVSRTLAGGLARLTWVTSGYGWLVIVAPFVMASPGYFGGRLSLGTLMVVVGAFNQVQGSLRWFVDNFSKIADWRATLLRVVNMREALRKSEQLQQIARHIELVEDSKDKLVLENFEAYLPSSGGECSGLEEPKVEITKGQHVLVMGDTSSARTTFFLTLAGLWPWGDGKIHLPPRNDLMFLPQRPYLPVGPLRAAIAYPEAPEHYADDVIKDALKRVGLERLTEELDHEGHWDRDLSLDEQQALGFSRVLLHSPKWVFSDNALSALDPQRRQAVLEAFQKALPESAMVTAGRQYAEDSFYTVFLNLRRCERRKPLPKPVAVLEPA